MVQQIPLSFPNTNNISSLDLLKGLNNQEVINFLFNNFLVGKEKIILIYGNRKVGKSYVSKLFIEKTKGKILTFPEIFNLIDAEILVNSNKVFLIEDINNLNLEQEKLLFRFYNLMMLSNSYLILTSRVAPKKIQFNLPDLQSRILSVRALYISEPQDDIIKQLIFKMFQEKQMNVNMAIINYILMRIERKCCILYDLIKRIEQEIFITKKKLTISLVKSVLKNNTKS